MTRPELLTAFQEISQQLDELYGDCPGFIQSNLWEMGDQLDDAIRKLRKDIESSEV